MCNSPLHVHFPPHTHKHTHVYTHVHEHTQTHTHAHAHTHTHTICCFRTEPSLLSASHSVVHRPQAVGWGCGPSTPRERQSNVSLFAGFPWLKAPYTWFPIVLALDLSCFSFMGNDKLLEPGAVKHFQTPACSYSS